MIKESQSPTFAEACQVARDLSASLPPMPDIATLYRAAMVMGMQIDALAPEWADRVLEEWRQTPPVTPVILHSAMIHGTIQRAQACRKLFEAQQAAMPAENA